MASFASSLHFLSLSPHSPSISNARSSLSSSLSLSSLKAISASASNGPLFLHFSSTPSASRFVARKVAVSSELGLEEEVSGGREEPSFAPDLKVFVGNLPFTVDSATLAGLFGQAGNVEMVEVIYDKFTGRSRGFGFVTMSTVEEAQGVAEQFNGYELEGRPLRVNYGPPPPKDESAFRGPRGGGSFDNNNRIHVSNLAWDVDDLALSNLFSEQGKVLEARVVNDRDTGRSRGFGFVTYSSAEEVTNAIESLDGVDLNGRSIRVSIAEARQRRAF